MSHGTPKAGSSIISGETTDVRYQKALKQITKLIGANNEIKEELSKAQEILAEYEQMLKEKDQAIEEIQNQKSRLQEELKELNFRCLGMKEENENLIDEINQARNKTSIENDFTQNASKPNPLVKSESEELRRIIDSLEYQLQQKNQIIREVSQKNAELWKNVDSYSYLPIDNGKQQNQSQLNRKLKTANNYIETLNRQCAELKGKLMKAESTNILLKVRSEKHLNFGSAHRVPHPKQNEEGASEIHKKFKRLESDYEKLTKKYEASIKEHEKIKVSFSEVDSEKNSVKQKLDKYQQLIQRQQKEIEELIVSHEKDINEMTQQFRERLLEQRQSFNPSKNAKSLKMMEGLQSENKSLKKKFQLCSIELTKCFKTLEIYKRKLAECEQDYNELVIERDELIEKLSKYQPGLNRERSSYSKSNSKFFVGENASVEYQN